MAEINVAFVGLLGVMTGGYFNNFLAEDYKRFRDGQALAGALAGELGSHVEAIPFNRAELSGWAPSWQVGNHWHCWNGQLHQARCSIKMRQRLGR